MQKFIQIKNNKCSQCGNIYKCFSSETYICNNCNQAISISLCPTCRQGEYKCPKCGADKSSIKQGEKGCLIDIWEVGNGPEMEVDIECTNNKDDIEFREWLINKGKAESTADDYHRRVFAWADKLEDSIKFAFLNLRAIFGSNQKMGESISAMLIAKVHEKKYAYYKEAKSGTSKKKRQKAAKSGNTTDNMVAFVNQYIKYCKECGKSVSLDYDKMKTLTSMVCQWQSKLTKNKRDIKTKIISSLISQDRAYTSIERWDRKKILAFPITLINKIMSDNEGYNQWKENVYESVLVYTSKNSTGIPISYVKSMRIEPYKRVLVEVGEKEYYLKTRKDTDTPFKILKVAKFADISIGHMPPISQVLSELEAEELKSLPAIERLSDLINEYFTQNNIAFVKGNVGNTQLMDAIYRSNENVWNDEFKHLLLNDLENIHNSEKYELQGTSENSSMGGINRK